MTEKPLTWKTKIPFGISVLNVDILSVTSLNLHLEAEGARNIICPLRGSLKQMKLTFRKNDPIISILFKGDCLF